MANHDYDPKYENLDRPNRRSIKVRFPGREDAAPQDGGEIAIPRGSPKGPGVRGVERQFGIAPKGKRDQILRQGYSVHSVLKTSDITTPRTDGRAQGVSKAFKDRLRRGIK